MPTPGGPEDHILVALDEAELVQTLDLLAAERRLKGEVELAQLLHRGQAAGAHRRLEPPVIPQLNLGGQQLLERFRRGECAAIDTLEDRIERFERARHPQVGEDLPQPVPSGERGGLHTTPPVSWAYAARARFSTEMTGRGVRGVGVVVGRSTISDV